MDYSDHLAWAVMYTHAARSLGMTGGISVPIHDELINGERGRWVTQVGTDVRLWVSEIYAQMEQSKGGHDG